jgi:hypothetical protein
LDWPRPFVLRAHHLDGQLFLPGKLFRIDVHLFDLRNPRIPDFVNAFALLAEQGIGPGRGRARLTAVEQLDADDQVMGPISDGESLGPTSVPAVDRASGSVRVRFLTPTELKCDGGLAVQPDFPVLFARARDRISMLCTLYGPGPFGIDFRVLGDAAKGIELTNCRIEAVRIERRSSRTGQTHSLGGFTGEAEYRGALGAFLPYLQIARWTGVGRQTTWGKGQIELVA